MYSSRVIIDINFYIIFYAFIYYTTAYYTRTKQNAIYASGVNALISIYTYFVYNIEKTIFPICSKLPKANRVVDGRSSDLFRFCLSSLFLFGKNDLCCAKSKFQELTAGDSVPDLHRIPFSILPQANEVFLNHHSGAKVVINFRITDKKIVFFLKKYY